MTTFRSHRPLALAAMATALGLAGIATASAADASVHVRGTIQSVTANGFTVQTDNGTQTIATTSSTRIVGVVPSSLSQIKAGTYVGTANVERNGHAQALEMVVFPASMKGAGLGNYGWDLAASGASGSAMTNGSVTSSNMTNGTVTGTSGGNSAMSGSAMTNGTVKHVSNSGSMQLVVNYGKGSKTINVPSDVPVVTFQPADKSALMQGAHVFVAGKGGSPVQAGMVAVGINGTVPPM